MEVRVRYLSRDIAKYFGSTQKRETVRLPDDAIYEDLIGLLRKKYDRAVEELRGGKLKERMFDALIIICDGKALRTMAGKSIESDREILVAYADFGG